MAAKLRISEQNAKCFLHFRTRVTSREAKKVVQTELKTKLFQEKLGFLIRILYLCTNYISNTSPIYLQYISNSSPIIVIGIILGLNWREIVIKFELNISSIMAEMTLDFRH